MKSNRYLYWITFIAVQSGLIFGLNMAGISGAVPLIKDYFGLTDVSLGIAVSSIMLGCLTGAMVIGSLSDKHGRKLMMIISAIIFIISSLGCAIADSLVAFVLSRFLSGVGVGFVSVLAPTYISEIAPAGKRGTLVTGNQFAIVIGILLAYVIDFGFAEVNHGWRYMMGAPVVFSVLFLLLLIVSFPESPRWLAKINKFEKAKKVLAQIGGEAFAEEELQNIKQATSSSDNQKVRLKELFQGKLAKVVLIGCALAAFQQITGINAVISYAPTIFSNTGVGGDQALMQSILVGVVNFLFTIVALGLIDKLGRKLLLLWGTAGMTLSIVCLVWTSYVEYNIGVLISLLSYIAFFAASLAPVMWVLISEIYPTRIRGLAMSLATAACWLFTFITVQFLPMMINQLGNEITFGIFGFFSFLAFLFIVKYIPETKGKSLEEIEKELGLN
ncbi:sugar porter family MFS transporter [Labilibacter sediminis]|nr:sugar porter family MFS transporter [Labilibacter sediminis]